MRPVAIVILNWNGADMLQRFLPSVLASAGSLATVYVADNGSDDRSEAVVRQSFPDAVWLPLDKNYGFAGGYNRALQQVDAPYLLLLNSDVEVSPGWLAPLYAYMEAHPDAAACQPKLLSQRDKAFFEYAGASGGFIDRLGYPFCRGRVLGCVERDEGQYDDVCPIFWATGAALFIRRTDFFAVGGFDERFFAHMEEIDLCWRLRSRGRSVVCVPQSVAYHVGAATLKKENPHKTFLNFRNNLLMLYKNLPDCELAGVMRWRALLDAVAMLRFLVSADWANFRAVWRARSEYRRLRPAFEADRLANRRAALQDAIPERRSFSLLFRYYVCGQRRFSRLG